MKPISLLLEVSPALAKALEMESKKSAPRSRQELLEDQSLREAQNHPFLNLLESVPQQEEPSKRPKLQVKSRKPQLKVRPQVVQPQKPLPSNKYLLDRAASLSKQLPSQINPKTNSLTEFVLTYVAPNQLSLANGIEDAAVILKDTLGEDPRLGAFSLTAEKYMGFGIKARLASEIANLLELSDVERDLFLLQVVSKDFSIDMTSEAINTMLTKIAKRGSNNG